jgi:tRNA(adenine34) deaminase
MTERDRHFMNLALDVAREAAARGEVPVGAILVENEQVIASSGNSKESEFDPLGHAEIRVIQAAAKALGRWRLTGCTLYVTLEPCTMCAGALVHARIDRVVYGATDPKAGAVESLYQILSDTRLNHRPIVSGGVLAEECGAILSDFFAARRDAIKKANQKS